jgi:tyrosine-protein kinase Etk/Wzc
MSVHLKKREVEKVMAPGGERASRREPPAAVPRNAREATLAEFSWTILQGRWTVLGSLVAALAIAFLYLWIATPKYRSSVLIQFEERTKTVAGLEYFSAMFREGAASVEIEIVRSRTLLNTVIEQLSLDVEAAPRTLPLIGKAIARRYAGAGPAPAVLGLRRFAWGGEKIRLSSLSVSRELLGERLTLTALGDGRYEVKLPTGATIVSGALGTPATGSSNGSQVDLTVQDLVAAPGTQFIITKQARNDVIEWFQVNLQVFEKVKMAGLLVVALTGPDPVATAEILDAVATNYQRQNVMVRSSEASQTLEFIESQLPTLKRQLDAAEAALNMYRLRKGTVDLSLETREVLDRIVQQERALSELELQRSELRQRFAGEHPSLATSAEKAARIRSQLSAAQERIRELPQTEVESARLVRDVKVNNELYVTLTNKAHELRVVKSGTIGNVRIVDRAYVPSVPSSPKKDAVLVIALLLGCGIGLGIVFIRKAMNEGASDPDEIEAASGIPVLVTIPRSEKQVAIARAARRHPGKRLPILSAVDPSDAAVENLIVLRTSVQVALAESRNNVVAVGGPSPGVGKTFVCVNLADVLAAAGQRVLIVDADLRRGLLHRYFGLERWPGITELIGGQASPSAAVRETGTPNLHVLATGAVPRHPADLVAGAKFQELMEALSKRYDVVIVDTPPILAVADSALIARHAGVNLLVLRAGKHPLDEISLAVKRFEQGGAQVSGVVLNDMPLVRGRYGKGGRYQRYEYRSDEVA